MNTITRRLRRLERSFGVIESENMRLERELLETVRRRIAEGWARLGIPKPTREDVSRLTVEQILHRGRDRARQAAIAEEAADHCR